MDWLSYRLAQLSGRERGLLALMLGVAIPLALIFLVAVPLLDRHAAARAALAEAEALRGWVAERVAALPPEGLSARAEADAPAPIGLSALEQSLVSVGLRGQVVRLANRSGGGVDLEFDAAPFGNLVAWLADIDPIWGYEIAAFRIERGAPGLASAALVLEPAQ